MFVLHVYRRCKKNKTSRGKKPNVKYISQNGIFTVPLDFFFLKGNNLTLKKQFPLDFRELGFFTAVLHAYVNKWLIFLIFADLSAFKLDAFFSFFHTWLSIARIVLTHRCIINFLCIVDRLRYSAIPNNRFCMRTDCMCVVRAW